MVRPVVYMLCGPVCVGKSTWVEKNIKMPFNLASTDAYIEAKAAVHGLTYNEVFKSEIDAATARMNDVIAWTVRERKNATEYWRFAVSYDIVWDQTNLTPKTRKNKMKAFDDSDYKRVAVAFVNAEKDIIMERNQARPGKVIPENVIDSMLTNYVVPKIENEPWFDEIMLVDANNGRLLSVELGPKNRCGLMSINRGEK